MLDLRPQNRPPMRQISGGHEIRPRGGLLPTAYFGGAKVNFHHTFVVLMYYLRDNMGCMTDFGYVILDTNLLMFMTIQACMVR